MKHQSMKQGQTTTRLCDKCVGSLTSPADHMTLKGALSRGILQIFGLSCSEISGRQQITHENHYLLTFKGRYGLNMSIEIGNNLKSLAKLFKLQSISIVAICSLRCLCTVSVL